MYLSSNKWLLALPFFFLAVAGAIFTIYPSVAMTTVVPTNFFPLIWSVLLTLSASASIYGILKPEKWFWEYISCLLLITLLVIYGIVIFAYAGTTSIHYLAPSLVVFAPASMILTRFLSLRAEIKSNRQKVTRYNDIHSKKRQ